MSEMIGVPYGTRTRVSAVKGQRPRPLDEGDAVGDVGSHSGRGNQAGNHEKTNDMPDAAD